VRVVEGLRLIPGGAIPVEPVAADPVVFQRECVDAFVASWRARGFSPVTIDNDIGLLERTLAALGRPAWEVTAEDIDRVVGELAVAGRAASTRREYVQIFKGFHRFLQTRKAADIEAGFGVRLQCPIDEFNASRHVGDDSPAVAPPAGTIGVGANTVTVTPRPPDTCSASSSDSSTTACNTTRPSTKPRRSQRRPSAPWRSERPEGAAASLRSSTAAIHLEIALRSHGAVGLTCADAPTCRLALTGR
jgi:hypothetical protein